MTEPATPAAAALAGTAAAIPMASTVAAAIGIPLDLLAIAILAAYASMTGCAQAWANYRAYEAAEKQVGK